MKCPQCKGRSTVALTVTTCGQKGEEKIDLPCPACKGLGSVSLAEKKIYEAQLAMWCRCGNPSGDVDFFDDGEHPDMYKHHYRCKDCGKITQVG